MVPYTPIHDRPPYFSSLPTPPRNRRPPSPRYAPPDLDPRIPYPGTKEALAMTEEYEHSDEEDYAEGGEEGQGGEGYYPGESEAGPSRKRPREDPEYENTNGNGSNYAQHAQHVPQGSHGSHAIPIMPSLFGISPRNPFTRTIGNFIMHHCRGRDNIEIEIKLGTLMTPTNPATGKNQRVKLPTQSEMILPPDYPTGPFVSNMNKHQHYSLNQLLNQATQQAAQSPYPIRFYRARQEDSFYASHEGGKVRVSRDMQTKEVIPGGCITKSRIADLNIYSPEEAFDWRVSVNTEEPCPMPDGPPLNIREKDRACYRHQLVQVDLTVVTARPNAQAKPTVSYELEIEVKDVRSLIAEGEKEKRGDPNSRFDEMLQSCLDTARMIIRNVG